MVFVGSHLNLLKLKVQFLQDEGVFVPTVGAAQSFTVLNFVQRNSDGQGTDTLIPTAQDPNTVTGVATIFTQDLWGHQGTGAGAAIYRQSRVGINQQNPLYQLDVNGNVTMLVRYVKFSILYQRLMVRQHS